MKRFDLVSCSLLALTCLGLSIPSATPAQQLFVGIESAGVPTRSTDLSGWPNVTYADDFDFELSAAAASPLGELFLCEGAFTTRLYSAELGSSPVLLSTISVDIHGLAYGRGTLWGYSNFADPKGIYQIDAATGTATLAHDIHTDTGFRFFALDYNREDDLLYGYTEFGASGLYSIDLDTGEMALVVGAIPASNTQGRALAIGNNTVYLTATRGDSNIPSFSYDLDQGSGGTWEPFTNAYPNHHSTGGAAWIPDQTAGTNESPAGTGGPLPMMKTTPNPFRESTVIRFTLTSVQSVKLDIYTAAGQHVVSLIEGRIENEGSQSVRWNGADSSGRTVVPGVYFSRLQIGTVVHSERLVLTR